MTNTKKDVGLSEFIITVQKQTGEVDPKKIAEIVHNQTPANKLQDYYMTALTAYCQTRMAVERNNVNKGATLALTNPTQHSGRSKKWGRASHSWFKNEFCAQSILTADGWKSQGELTHDDLQFVVNARKETAAENLASAKKYEELDKLMTAKGVTTVSELAEDDVKKIFC